MNEFAKLPEKEKMKIEDERMKEPISDEEFEQRNKFVNTEKSIDDLDPRAFRTFVPPKNGGLI